MVHLYVKVLFMTTGRFHTSSKNLFCYKSVVFFTKLFKHTVTIVVCDLRVLQEMFLTSAPEQFVESPVLALEEISF